MAAKSKMAAASPATNLAARTAGSSTTSSTLATPWKASRERCSTGMTLMPEGAAEEAAGPAPSGPGLGGAAVGSRRLNLPTPSAAAGASVAAVDVVLD